MFKARMSEIKWKAGTMRIRWEFEVGAPSSVTPTPSLTPPQATLFSLQGQQTGDRSRKEFQIEKQN